MKHITRITTQRPRKAESSTVGVVFTAISQILQVVGTLLIEKQQLTMDPYDY